eukprot:COSAG02_NODE_4815_length_4944_cov_12.040867_5_plen_347_part_00
MLQRVHTVLLLAIVAGGSIHSGGTSVQPALTVGTIGGGHNEPLPPPPPNGCDCVDFCAGSCSYNASALPHAGASVNLTVMRETPVGVYSLGNKDTADSAGDLAFGLRTLYYSYLCRHVPSYKGCFLNTATVYLRAELEVSGEFGPYQSCNPLPNASAKSEFHCMPQAWPCTHTLGKLPCPRAESTIGYEDVAKRHANSLKPLNPPGGFKTIMERTEQWKVHVAVTTGGSWYSIPACSECKGSQVPSTLPTGCTWRLRAPPRVFNATCVNDRLRAAVEAYAARSSAGGCFDQRCSAEERADFGSDCYTECLFDVLLGNETEAPAMTKEQLMVPWEAAFAPTTGCPVV